MSFPGRLMIGNKQSHSLSATNLASIRSRLLLAWLDRAGDIKRTWPFYFFFWYMLMCMCV